jgi:hypothetical protein
LAAAVSVASSPLDYALPASTRQRRSVATTI